MKCAWWRGCLREGSRRREGGEDKCSWLKEACKKDEGIGKREEEKRRNT